RVREQLGDAGVSPEVAAEILAATRAAGGVSRARDKARALAADAVTELEAVPPSPLRDAPRDLALPSVQRTSPWPAPPTPRATPRPRLRPLPTSRRTGATCAPS